mmetsp:Transcript_18089/g.45358  ORF Transcript_18089/g.45358 Transcript_18089/m.45358 type:complete len:244 (+) Transcript_18089:853-1584(+)
MRFSFHTIAPSAYRNSTHSYSPDCRFPGYQFRCCCGWPASLFAPVFTRSTRSWSSSFPSNRFILFGWMLQSRRRLSKGKTRSRSRSLLRSTPGSTVHTVTSVSSPRDRWCGPAWNLGRVSYFSSHETPWQAISSGRQMFFGRSLSVGYPISRSSTQYQFTVNFARNVSRESLFSTAHMLKSNTTCTTVGGWGCSSDAPLFPVAVVLDDAGGFATTAFGAENGVTGFAASPQRSLAAALPGSTS